MHYPAHGAASDFTHLASECAADQDRFWEFHDQLMARNARLYSPGGAGAYAEQLGMDREAFDQCISDKTYQGRVRDSLREARAQGVSFTPVIFVDGRRVQPTADAVIAAAKAAAQ